MKLFSALLALGFLTFNTLPAFAHSKSKTTVYVKKTFVTKSVRHKNYHYHVRSHGHGHAGHYRPRPRSYRAHRGYSYGRGYYGGYGYSVGHRTGGHH